MHAALILWNSCVSLIIETGIISLTRNIILSGPEQVGGLKAGAKEDSDSEKERAEKSAEKERAERERAERERVEEGNAKPTKAKEKQERKIKEKVEQKNAVTKLKGEKHVEQLAHINPDAAVRQQMGVLGSKGARWGDEGKTLPPTKETSARNLDVERRPSSRRRRRRGR